MTPENDSNIVNNHGEVIYSVYDVTLGRGPVAQYARRGKMHWPQSILYFCPECGSAWGRIEVCPPTLSGWSARSRRCPDHGPGLLLPSNLDNEFPDPPAEVLKWEILALERFKKPLSHYFSYLITGDIR